MAIAGSGIGLGTQFTLALKADGTVWAWGNGSDGQLGDGRLGDAGSSATPVQVSGLSGVVAIAAGAYNGYALRQDGTVWAWGSNSRGQLGTGAFQGPSIAVPAQVSGLTSVVAIAASVLSARALTSDGGVWAWGDGDLGALGLGDNPNPGSIYNVPTPTRIPGLTNVSAITGGHYNGYALKTDGTVWAWGDNGGKQLGRPDVVSSFTPLPVPGLTGITALASHSAGGTGYALAGDSTVWAWGVGAQGQLGNGVTPPSNDYSAATPARVVGLSGAKGISASQGDGYALLGDGTVRSWGSNFAGALGNGNSDSIAVSPTQVLVAGVSAVLGGFGNAFVVGGSSGGTTTTTTTTSPPLPSLNLSVSPTHGPPGTDFRVTYSCHSTVVWLEVLDAQGNQARDANIGLATGNGVDFSQHIVLYTRGTYVAVLHCGSQEARTPIVVDNYTVKYVALGDSFSAGEGIEPFFDLNNKCHRSELAYSLSVEQQGVPDKAIYQRSKQGEVGVEWGFQACSGATTASMLTEGHHGDPLPQLALSRVGDVNNPYSLPVDNNTTLITLTIGGNDVEFSKILEFCYNEDNCENKIYKDKLPLAAVVSKLLSALSDKLDAVYSRIRLQAPQARVLVLGYPQLFPATISEQRCHKLSNPDPRNSKGFTTTEQTYLRTQTTRMNNLIRDRSQKAGAEFVRVDQVFAGHEICGSGIEWINAPTFSLSTSKINDQSFHPNSCGQNAMAMLVNLRLNGKTRDVVCPFVPGA